MDKSTPSSVDDAMYAEVKALRAELKDFRDHISHIGYLVQIIEARGRRTPLISPRIKTWILRGLQPIRRLSGALSHPRRSFSRITAIFSEAFRTSSRAVKTRDGWRQYIHVGFFIDTVADLTMRRLRPDNTPYYRINQHKPNILDRPKILHAIPNVFVGGSTQLIVDLQDYLGHQYEMHVMTSAFPAGGSHEGMTIHDFREPTTSAAMIDLMKKFQPNVLHVHYWGEVDVDWYSKVFHAANELSIPVILNINTPVQPFIDPSVEYCVYVSDYVKEKFGGVFKEESVIHPGINLERFTPATQQDRYAADSVGMVYRLEPDKLNMEAIEIMIEVVKRRPATRIIVVGGGSLFDPFVAKTEERGVRQNFDFTGYVKYEALSQYYAMFSIFVAPVWKESFGQVTPFAMAMGLAVAGNNVGALPEILQSDATLGNSVDETAQKIVDLLDNPHEVARLSKRNREIALAKYSVEGMCKEYDVIYRHVLGQKTADPMPGFPKAEFF